MFGEATRVDLLAWKGPAQSVAVVVHGAPTVARSLYDQLIAGPFAGALASENLRPTFCTPREAASDARPDGPGGWSLPPLDLDREQDLPRRLGELARAGLLLPKIVNHVAAHMLQVGEPQPLYRWRLTEEGARAAWLTSRPDY